MPGSVPSLGWKTPGNVANNSLLNLVLPVLAKSQKAGLCQNSVDANLFLKCAKTVVGHQDQIPPTIHIFHPFSQFVVYSPVTIKDCPGVSRFCFVQVVFRYSFLRCLPESVLESIGRSDNRKEQVPVLKPA